MTLAAALVAVGIGALLDQVGVLSLSVADLIAVALVMVAGGLVVGAFVGRARWLIAVAFALLPVLAVAAVVDAAPRLVGGPIITEDGGAGDRLYTPTDVEDVRSSYSLGTGRLELDLSQVEVPAGETVDIDVQVTAGEIDVRLPADASADLDGQALVGEVRLLDRRSTGFRVVTSESAPGEADAGEIRMDLRVTAGSIGVHQALPAGDDGDANDPGDDGDDPASGGGGSTNDGGEPTADGSAATRRVGLVGALPGGLALRLNVPWLPATTTQNGKDR